MAEDGPYEVLGVAPAATTAEIRTAYLALARRHHPDRLNSRPPAEQAVAAARMARINAAWTLLSDPARRAAYDAGTVDAEASSGHVRDPGGAFRPFDLDDDDHVDPRLLDDTPTGAPTMRSGLSLLPAAFAAAGVVVFGAGALFGFVGLLGAGLGLLLASALSFLLLPLFALLASSRADRDP